MTRQERAAVAGELRAQGKLHREIAEIMGVSRSYAAELCDDPDGVKVRARKASYRGTCQVCGIPTDGSNGGGKAPRYCRAHVWTDEEYRAKQTKWTRELLVERIREWASEHGEPPAMADWNAVQAREMGDEWRAIRFENDDRWPWFVSVVRAFGSWNAGIEAAGFEPRVSGGGCGNQRRRRGSYVRPNRERWLLTQILEPVGIAKLAQAADVCRQTIWVSLNELRGRGLVACSSRGRNAKWQLTAAGRLALNGQRAEIEAMLSDAPSSLNPRLLEPRARSLKDAA